MYLTRFDTTWTPAATWSLRLALFGMLVAAIGILLARIRAVDPVTALVILGFAWAFALAAVLLALSAAVKIWQTGQGGTGMVAGALLLAAALLAPAAWFSVQSVRLPLLNDVSTDLAEPPDFMRSSRAMAARGGQIPGNVDASVREAQRRAYPNVQPVVIDLDIEEAWQLVLKAIAARGWRISDQSLPGGRIRIGHIDAVDRTLILGFPDDITLRLRPLPGQTRIDLRSVSRYGRHDFGTNAKRIAAFAAELQAQLDAR